MLHIIDSLAASFSWFSRPEYISVYPMIPESKMKSSSYYVWLKHQEAEAKECRRMSNRRHKGVSDPVMGTNTLQFTRQI
jgi:hypothetical protein